MTRPIEILADIPREEWIDLGYMLLVPSIFLVALPLLILWFRP